MTPRHEAAVLQREGLQEYYVYSIYQILGSVEIRRKQTRDRERQVR